jgi:hypothetical protein
MPRLTTYGWSSKAISSGPGWRSWRRRGGQHSRTLAGRSLSLDVTAVGHVDSAGKYLPALLRGSGAELLASRMVMTDLVRTIADDWPLRAE